MSKTITWPLAAGLLGSSVAYVRASVRASVGASVGASGAPTVGPRCALPTHIHGLELVGSPSAVTGYDTETWLLHELSLDGERLGHVLVAGRTDGMGPIHSADQIAAILGPFTEGASP